MRNIYIELAELLKGKKHLASATIIETEGSTPQIEGASAIFSSKGIVRGTLGGGALEADAERKALEAIKKGISFLYEFELEGNVTEEEAICGGRVKILIDAFPQGQAEAFLNLRQSLLARKSGVLATLIESPSQKDFSLSRTWIRDDNIEDIKKHPFSFFQREIKQAFQEGRARLIKAEDVLSGDAWKEGLLFLEPLFPLPQLVIAGAGHVGQAVSHLGNFLSFEVIVIDDRPEFANSSRLPDADQIIVDDVGKAIKDFQIGSDTYLVIVTRGHSHDAEALRECLNRDAAYIGMIGSKRKTNLMRERFLKEGWATPSQFDKIYAPIGIDIHSKTVEEIALSIAAQLVLIRHELRERKEGK